MTGFGDIPIYPFWSQMDRQDKSEIEFWDITLTFYAFELLCVILVFQPKRSQKRHFSSFSSKIAMALFGGFFISDLSGLSMQFQNGEMEISPKSIIEIF